MKDKFEKIDSIPVGAELCTGCSACASICPTGAIKMSVDREGFYAPVFNKELCTNCKLCTKVCPIKECHFNNAADTAYAVMIKDEKIRLSCSSGGVAYALSKYVIDNDGYVCGCINQNFETFHEIISKDNLYLFDKLKGSKYVQSDIRDVFKRIKILLRDKKLVLFIGTGCQVAGLKNYLIKPYANLITVDFICHGVPSPKVLTDYCDMLKQKYYSATTYSTRDKVDGWQGHHEFNLFDDNGENIFRENGKFNLYIRSFLANYINRKSCSRCKFAQVQRVSDITVGDFWKIRKYNKKFDDKKGTSLVLCNSEAGQKILDKTQDYYTLCEPVPIDFAKEVQPHLSHPAKENINRQTVFKLMDDNSDYIAYLNRKIVKVGLLSFHFANDYGSVLITYALQNIVKKLGFVPEIINFIGKEVPVKPNFVSFRDNFLKLSPLAEDYDSLCKLQRYYQKIIVGSNQVWRFFDQNVYMLKFASGIKSLISYAASFGKVSYSATDTESAKHLLSRFSSISVREQTGVNICQNQFGLPALRVLDPTLLLDADDYQSIIDFYAPQNINQEYIGYSLSKKNKEQNSDILSNNQNFGNKFLIKDITRSLGNDKDSNVGEWLNCIKNSKCVITDSYHAIIFSIIFKRNFICLLPSENKSGPVFSLLSLFNLTDRIVKTLNDVKPNLLNNAIHYDELYKKLNIEKKRSLNYLKNSLEKKAEKWI
ncbi:MAG: polysaccharide pyruvyl transferase family protein [Ruminobacter sp.]|uniref:polysaccharide pyruvyl transferase family protein n=1 Tax=Ruminobacter sp. TaxID=2774296 RepID=UPI001B46B542|nr:polysaccharide pyruvyl transferase family protein [Ruminobacter sp.]MBP3749799.1 polysaccharide pyruvyl transferase family protein [Ruminobacter sp.]